MLAGDKFRCYQFYSSGSSICTDFDNLVDYNPVIGISASAVNMDALVEIVEPGLFTQWVVKVLLFHTVSIPRHSCAI